AICEAGESANSTKAASWCPTLRGGANGEQDGFHLRRRHPRAIVADGDRAVGVIDIDRHFSRLVAAYEPLRPRAINRGSGVLHVFPEYRDGRDIHARREEAENVGANPNRVGFHMIFGRGRAPRNSRLHGQETFRRNGSAAGSISNESSSSPASSTISSSV